MSVRGVDTGFEPHHSATLASFRAQENGRLRMTDLWCGRKFSRATAPETNPDGCMNRSRSTSNMRSKTKAEVKRRTQSTIRSKKKPECTASSLPSNSDDRLQRTSLGLLDEQISFEEVSNWGSSFDKLMQSKSGQKYFAEFLKGEFSDENILFWQACEELKRERNAEKVEEKARIIYEDFVSILSPKEVSLDSRVREIINTNMVHPTARAFDDAQAQIYTLMQRDSYPRFVVSAMYRKLLESFGVVEEVQELAYCTPSSTTIHN